MASKRRTTTTAPAEERELWWRESVFDLPKKVTVVTPWAASGGPVPYYRAKGHRAHWAYGYLGTRFFETEQECLEYSIADQERYVARQREALERDVNQLDRMRARLEALTKEGGNA